MVVFRCTRKLLDRLARPTELAPAHSTAVLGDWYVTLLFARPQWVLLFVSESTRLPIVLPARELATMAPRFGVALAHLLQALNIDAPFVARELGAMSDAAFATTQNRRVLGTSNDFSFQVRWILQATPTLTLHQLSLELAQTPIHPLHDYPARATRRLLLEKPIV